ncbi:MAG: inositol oxygenase [Verrucomicrobia bacterium]|nr:inositol oxygenase [Verrucomicrobiota bacterium]
MSPISIAENQPLQSLDEVEDFYKERYPEPKPEGETKKPVVGYAPDKKENEFRNYEADARPTVREFYRLNHQFQTREFVQSKKREYLGLNRMKMGIWEAAEYLNQLVDDSDPDTDMSQLEHLLQTAEQLRRDGQPRWMILTGFVHDLGKILCLWGEPQWAVVGDTFPTGCAYSPKIVFPRFFEANPDFHNPAYQTKLGVYQEGCGLDAVDLSWGHDEYIYSVCKDYLPQEGLAMLRFHSFYPWHREGAYEYLLNDHDRAMLPWVNKFNPYDLYTKSHEKPDAKKLKPFYDELIHEFFPDKVRW